MESTLQAQFKDLTGDVGFFLGYGRGLDNDDDEWTADQLKNITRSVKGGLRNFCHCGYEWSFLKPFADFTLAQGETSLELPGDFGGIEGECINTTAANSMLSAEIQIFNESMIRKLLAEQPTTTGRPTRAALSPTRNMTVDHSPRTNLLFFPIADQDYTITLQYYFLPDYLDGTHPFVYGGAEHAETVLESCLAVAEKILDKEATLHDAVFKERLAVSRDMDARKKPQIHGYNGDGSDLRRLFKGRSFAGFPVVTVNGISPV